MAEGFLGRWSRRKQDALAGKPLDEPVSTSLSADTPATTSASRAPTQAQGQPRAQAPQAACAPAPTLEDVQALNTQSDFQPFVARSVAPEVRNAAFKKLFTDPHFNVMDGLDIYIDDYTRPDPLPLAILQKMVGAQLLGLIKDDAAPVPSPDAPAQPVTPPSTTPTALERPIDHDPNPDLRLQPDHAAGCPGTGPSIR